MKLVPVIFLLFLLSLVGCSSQPDQSTASSKTNSQGREAAEQPAAETDTKESTATASTKPEGEAKPEKEAEPEEEPKPEPEKEPEPGKETEPEGVIEPKPPEAKQQNAPSPAIDDAPGNDQATAPSGTTTLVSETTSNPEPQTPPETAGGLPIVKKVKELVPVSWLQRIRFWDMANRIIAQRDGEPAGFGEAELKEFASALKQVQALHDHMYRLQGTLQERANFANSEYFKQQILASLRGETSLPAGTRDRSKKLSSLQLYEIKRENGLAEQIEAKLIRDQVTKGDLLRLSLRLREELMLFLVLREAEIVLDEFFLSFPWKSSPESNLGKIQGWYPNVMQTTARELWMKTPPKWFKEDFPKLSKVNVFKRGPHEYVSPIELSRGPRVNTLPSVMDNSDFQKLVALADRFEEMSGGGDRLLIFPEIGDLPLRDRVVEASRRNLEAFKEADVAALKLLRKTIFDQLSADSKTKVKSIKNDSDRARISWQIPKKEWDLYCKVEGVDRAIESMTSGSFSPGQIPKRFMDESQKLMLESRREVFDTGARFYFEKQEKQER